MFNDQVVTTPFDPMSGAQAHAIYGSDQAAGPAKFQGTQCGADGRQCVGNNVLPGDTRHLWFEFRAPSITRTEAQSGSQVIQINVTAELE
jgi:hypothetical protein